MCFGSSKGDADPDNKRNADIEKQIRTDQRRNAQEVKILLLGAGESGKSTILKQMRLIHNAGFTPTERKQWKVTIFSNLMHAFQCISGCMEEHEVDFEQSENLKYMEFVCKDVEIGPDDSMPADYQKAFQSLWEDDGVQTAITKGHEYALHDNLDYYLKHIDRLFGKDYLPDNQDILRARLRTTGISETLFETGRLTYRMFDVGGQRSERKKWIHVFDNVQVVLFLVAVSGFDHVLVEDRNGNQMQEALMLFESISNSKYFDRAGLVLFLNKMDLFTDKVFNGKANIADFFPDYRGGAKDVEAGARFFADKFKNLVRSATKEVYVHYTNATDTNLLDKTMKSVQDMIVQRNLHSLML
ncbi:Guanine nucleotide-binding protein alpha-2 subunit-like protein [Elsinoe fawcettii]|nr:Guanine nucleotide-binding protein alpha-2 subunit-like protein [Elsinoe fawcettii]